METKIELTRKEFLTLKGFVGKNPARPGFHNIRIIDDTDEHRVYAIATNGICIIKFQLKDRYIDTYQIGFYRLEQIEKQYYAVYNKDAVPFPKYWSTVLDRDYSSDVIILNETVESYATIVSKAINMAYTKFTVIDETFFKCIPQGMYKIKIDKSDPWTFLNSDVSIQVVIMPIQFSEKQNFDLNRREY